MSPVSTPQQPRVIAEQGGLVIAEDGPRVLVIDRGTGPLQILAFVVLIITVVFGGFGVVSLVMAATGSLAQLSAAISTGLLLVGCAAGVGALFLVRALRRRRRAALDAFVPVAVFDRQHQVYLDGAGRSIARLDQVRFERRMQVGSSSSKLVAVTPAGTHDLKRGNPFGGSIGGLDATLTAAVFGRPR